jgi:gliding motility-associated-like protein
MKALHRNILFGFALQRIIYLLIIIFLSSAAFTSYAQCPTNIDFEKGDFSGWDCWIGTHSLLSATHDTIDVGNLVPPTYGRHQMLSASPGNGVDPFGLFPQNCPNGSGHSIKLGDSTVFTNPGISKAQGVSYVFTIPAGQNNFSLIYHYAVVFKESIINFHSEWQQANFVIEVKNLTDNILLDCSSFSFHATSGVPGFFNSPVNPDVKCKDWAAGYINLDGNAGKTIQLFFKSATCVPSGHFGYAYVDVNTECNSSFTGAVFCPDDKFINLTAPPGFNTYKWFNAANTTLGTGPKLHLSPPPRAGDSVYVEFTPYSGYGCVDTLTIYLSDTLKVKADAGADGEFCVNPSIRLGIDSTPGEIYRWSPAAGLSDPGIVLSAQYTLTVTSPGGGCLTTDVVNLVKKCGVIEFYVPNAFNPNSNSSNNTLRPFLYGYSKVNYFRVYNRYGQLLYSKNSDLPGWDGTIHGKPAAPQTVVWMIEAVDAYGKIEKRQGTSILLR